jgi:hypothetical protein
MEETTDVAPLRGENGRVDMDVILEGPFSRLAAFFLPFLTHFGVVDVLRGSADLHFFSFI